MVELSANEGQHSLTALEFQGRFLLLRTYYSYSVSNPSVSILTRMQRTQSSEMHILTLAPGAGLVKMGNLDKVFCFILQLTHEGSHPGRSTLGNFNPVMTRTPSLNTLPNC